MKLDTLDVSRTDQQLDVLANGPAPYVFVEVIANFPLHSLEWQLLTINSPVHAKHVEAVAASNRYRAELTFFQLEKKGLEFWYRTTTAELSKVAA